MQIDIAENSRVFVTGKTGSGKTHFSKSILAPVNRLVVFDIKDNLAGEMNLVPATGANGNTIKDNWRKFLRGKDIRLQVTAPRNVVGSEEEYEFYHEWFRKVFLVADTMVYIDELLGVLKSSVDLPKWLKAIYTRGREPVYGRKNRIVRGNIGVIACTQRPSHIPVFCMTESEEFFIFQLQNPDDRKKVAAYTSPEIAQPIPDEHGFYYYKTRSNEPFYVQEL